MSLPYFIVVLVIIWGLPELVWSFLGEKLRSLIFMFAEGLKLQRKRNGGWYHDGGQNVMVAHI